MALNKLVGDKPFDQKVEVEVGHLLTIISDLNYLQGKVEGMEETIKILREFLGDGV